MTLDKVIEILKLHTHGHPRPIDPDFDNAIDIAIEALNFYSDWKKSRPSMSLFFLPGETLE